LNKQAEAPNEEYEPEARGESSGYCFFTDKELEQLYRDTQNFVEDETKWP
jgi:hypothetical protein